MCFANCGVSNQIRGRWAVEYEPIQIGTRNFLEFSLIFHRKHKAKS